MQSKGIRKFLSPAHIAHIEHNNLLQNICVNACHMPYFKAWFLPGKNEEGIRPVAAGRCHHHTLYDPADRRMPITSNYQKMSLLEVAFVSSRCVRLRIPLLEDDGPADRLR